MKCHYCGAEVADGNHFCLWCGTRQEPQPDAEEQTRPWAEEVPEPVPAAPELPAVQPAPAAPVQQRIFPPAVQLPTKRGLGKMFFLGILTLGIYPTVIWSRIVTELNLAASRYDGKRTMTYFGMLMLAPITLGIYAFVWMHKFCRRIGDELERRGLDYRFGPSAFWLWNVLGSLIIVGPFVFCHKLMKSMNKINADFNTNG